MSDFNNYFVAIDMMIDKDRIGEDIPNRLGNVEATLNNSKYYYLNNYNPPLPNIINISNLSYFIICLLLSKKDTYFYHH